MGMKKGVILAIVLLVVFPSAFAVTETIDVDSLRPIGIVIHAVELALALFISFVSLKFFKITKPLNVFLYVYLALGFFTISSLFYLLFYLGGWINVPLEFSRAYIASRLSLIAMLSVFVVVFFNAMRVMKMQK